MAIGLLSMLTPLEERVERWVATGNATKILLHPEDYLSLSDHKRGKMEAKYSMPVVALGGERGIRDHLNRQKSAQEIEANETQPLESVVDDV